MHRSYFACYLVIGIILLLEQIRKETIYWKVVLVIIFSIGVLQTSSKAGILCMFLVFTVYGILFMLSKNRWFGWIQFGALSIIFILIFLTKNPIKKRFDASWTAMENIKTENNSTVESNEVRLIMWKTSWEVWKSNFVYGTGTGDYNDELNSYNLKKGNLGAAKEELNSHNQFLNTSVQLGIFGLLVLCMIFISSFIVSGNSIWKIMVLITFIVNFLVESFLETQSGIVLFCIILILFFTNQGQTKSKTISIL
jgi:O-antigen ligase